METMGSKSSKGIASLGTSGVFTLDFFLIFLFSWFSILVVAFHVHFQAEVIRKELFE